MLARDNILIDARNDHIHNATSKLNILNKAIKVIKVV